MKIGYRVVSPKEVGLHDADLVQITAYGVGADDIKLVRRCAEACGKKAIPYVVHPVGLSLIGRGMSGGPVEMAKLADLALIFHDERAPKLKEAQASGGTGLFKDQAACPFRAFAKHRLGARSLDEPEIGLSPMQRGQLAHECLQLFWEKVSSHKELIGLTGGALALHINQ